MLTTVLTVALLGFAGALQIGNSDYIDECTEDGQLQIKNQLLSLFQEAEVEQQKPSSYGPNIAANGKGPSLATPPTWPKDLLEDPGTPLATWLDTLPDDARWKTVTLMKSFNPYFWMDTYLKEKRDNTLCNIKRMECMSIDDMGLPLESEEGTRAWFAVYDSLSHEQQKAVNKQLTELRKTVVEPALSAYFYETIYPGKTMIETLQVPSTYPGGPIASLPAPVEGDWNVDADYSRAYGQYLPTALRDETQVPTAPRWMSALVQVTEAGRQQCNDRSTEAKKIMCHLDFGGVLGRIGKEMKKKGLTPELGDAHLKRVDEIMGKLESLKQDSLAKCATDRKEE